MTRKELIQLLDLVAQEKSTHKLNGTVTVWNIKKGLVSVSVIMDHRGRITIGGLPKK